VFFCSLFDAAPPSQATHKGERSRNHQSFFKRKIRCHLSYCLKKKTISRLIDLFVLSLRSTFKKLKKMVPHAASCEYSCCPKTVADRTTAHELLSLLMMACAVVLTAEEKPKQNQRHPPPSKKRKALSLSVLCHLSQELILAVPLRPGASTVKLSLHHRR
jgi:hypothetical protein